MSEQQSTFQVRAETSQVSYATAFLLFCCGHGRKQKSKRTSAGDGEDAKVVAGGGFAGVAESQSHAGNCYQAFFLHVDLLNLYSTTKTTIFVS